MITDFRLKGLSKPKSATLEFINTDKETIFATIEMPDEKIEALWGYCKGNWEDAKIAEVEHDGFNTNGLPIKPKVIGIREWDLPISRV